MPTKYNYNIVNIHQNKEKFKNDILNKTLHDILILKDNEDELRDDLCEALQNEKKLLTKQHWYADSSTKLIFEKDGLLEKLQDRNESFKNILTKIINSYINEIANHFDPLFYNVTKTVNYFLFSRLLNSIKLKLPNNLSSVKRLSTNQISILGNVDLVKKLSKQGTLIFVPTHYSNLDSLLIGMILDAMELPPVIYGAGLNLFTNVTNGFLNKVGAYKIDRRKKNIIYLNTIKNYSVLAIHYGCDSLFFPGGTRSRSGDVESNLKLGLLKSTISAQGINCLTQENAKAKKIFIIPLIINYPFVFEAASLVRDYIKKTYGIKIDQKKNWYEKSFSFLKNTNNLISKKLKLTASFGDPMDVLGNMVDKYGNSLDSKGNIINVYEIFEREDFGNANELREISKRLSQNIVTQFRIHNVVITSSLLAFTAFEILLSEQKDLSIEEFLQQPNETFKLNSYVLMKKMQCVREVILDYAENDLIDISKEIKELSIEEIIQDGLDNLGAYNYKRPLVFEKNNYYTTEDICSLFYYRNRLVGYELEKYI